MDDSRMYELSWLPELMDQVRQALVDLNANQVDLRPQMLAELRSLEEQIAGWTISLGSTNLPDAARDVLLQQLASAAERKQKIAADLASQMEQPTAEQLLSENDVRCRLLRLPEVLTNGSPTLGNFELSQHIDKIVCYPDGKVVMRTCKLGAMPQAIEQFRDPAVQVEGKIEQQTGERIQSRRRSKLRVTEAEDDNVDLDALVHFVADSNRFAGLGPEWFWTDSFHVPKESHWYVENAEAVFLKRQTERLSFEELSKIFGVSKPTIAAANRHYLETHPGVKDQVNLSAGGSRKKRIDVRPIANEVRQKWWDEHWSKLRLSRKYECATTTIDRALKVAYEMTGEQVPSDKDRRQHQIAVARKMLEEGHGLEQIAKALDIAGFTAHIYLKRSFAAEGKPMPDLRRRDSKRQSQDWSPQ